MFKANTVNKYVNDTNIDPSAIVKVQDNLSHTSVYITQLQKSNSSDIAN